MVEGRFVGIPPAEYRGSYDKILTVSTILVLQLRPLWDRQVAPPLPPQDREGRQNETGPPVVAPLHHQHVERPYPVRRGAEGGAMEGAARPVARVAAEESNASIVAVPRKILNGDVAPGEVG